MIEASDPRGWWLRPLYLFHLKRVLPLFERLMLRGARDFAMIGTYSSNFGDSSAFAEMLRAEGLEGLLRVEVRAAEKLKQRTVPLVRA